MYALIDCNNFYASCERVFNPKLRGRPVVVLSNNDGCVIARSQEAKDIGIPMGAPAFKSKHLFQRFNVAVFSANFVLYGDISARIMTILQQFVPDIEIYSIDEAFLKLNFIQNKNLRAYGLEIRDYIGRSTGIPISVGIAPTKTLAKICSHKAKKIKEYDGIFDWNEIKDKDNLLKSIPVGDIWGVGFKTSYKLQEYGIYNALQLRNTNEVWLRKKFSVTMLRTCTELKGIPCFTLEGYSPKRAIMSSRSFGRPVENIQELQEAVATYTSRACEKLREQQSAASHIYVSIKTNMHKKDQIQYCAHRIKSLSSPSFYNPDFINKAFEGLSEIYKSGLRYKKATVMLLGILPQNQIQLGLFERDENLNSKTKIMNVFDNINNRYGREIIKYGAVGIKQNWRMKHEMCSPRYTTEWRDLLKIRI